VPLKKIYLLERKIPGNYSKIGASSGWCAFGLTAETPTQALVRPFLGPPKRLGATRRRPPSAGAVVSSPAWTLGQPSEERPQRLGLGLWHCPSAWAPCRRSSRLLGCLFFGLLLREGRVRDQRLQDSKELGQLAFSFVGVGLLSLGNQLIMRCV
jgi:hypothetical protein